MKRIALNSQLFLCLTLFFGISGFRVQAHAAPVVLDSNSFVDLAKKVVPSVVNISTLSTVKSPFSQGAPDDLFRRFFEDFFGREFGMEIPGEEGPPQRPKKGLPRLPKAVALGSGFIIDSSGLILTNNHVVAGADEIKINFTETPTETATDGEVVGRDAEIDVALIRVKTKRMMTPLPFGDSDATEVGAWVVAVGNPFGQGHSVTHGIISAKGRTTPQFPLGTYLQTDAPINPGNSGGPLVNLNGEVIGINNAIEARAQGIGFAIPSNLVKNILPQLRTKGTVSRGYIGILAEPLNPQIAEKIGVTKTLQAPFVTQVYPGDPADRAGIKPYDVITEVDHKPVQSPTDLIAAIIGIPVGKSIPVKVLRGKKTLDLQVKVSQRPGSQEFEGKKSQKEKDSAGKPKKEAPPVETGMVVQDSPRTGEGVIVTQVAPGGPADRAGLAMGDVILEVDREGVKDVKSFYSRVKKKKSHMLRIKRKIPQGEAFRVVILDLTEE